MKRTNKFITALLSCVLILGALAGCNNNSTTSEIGYLDPIIRTNIDKTETTDIDCTIVELSTKTHSTVFNSFVRYYVTVKDCNGAAYRFCVDELDWKGFKEGDVITVQQIQEYTDYNAPYKPYYSFRGKKLTLQVINAGKEKAYENSTDKGY